MYATDKNGEGRVMEVGEFDSLEEVEVITNIFGKDVVLNFEYKAIPFSTDEEDRTTEEIYEE